MLPSPTLRLRIPFLSWSILPVPVLFDEGDQVPVSSLQYPLTASVESPPQCSYRKDDPSQWGSFAAPGNGVQPLCGKWVSAFGHTMRSFSGVAIFSASQCTKCLSNTDAAIIVMWRVAQEIAHVRRKLLVRRDLLQHRVPPDGIASAHRWHRAAG